MHCCPLEIFGILLACLLSRCKKVLPHASKHSSCWRRPGCWIAARNCVHIKHHSYCSRELKYWDWDSECQTGLVMFCVLCYTGFKIGKATLGVDMSGFFDGFCMFLSFWHILALDLRDHACIRGPGTRKQFQRPHSWCLQGLTLLSVLGLLRIICDYIIYYTIYWISDEIIVCICIYLIIFVCETTNLVLLHFSLAEVCVCANFR